MVLGLYVFGVVVSEILFVFKFFNLWYFVLDVEGVFFDGFMVFDLVVVLYLMVVVVGVLMEVVVCVICEFELIDC